MKTKIIKGQKYSLAYIKRNNYFMITLIKIFMCFLSNF